MQYHYLTEQILDWTFYLPLCKVSNHQCQYETISPVNIWKIFMQSISKPYIEVILMLTESVLNSKDLYVSNGWKHCRKRDLLNDGIYVVHPQLFIKHLDDILPDFLLYIWGCTLQVDFTILCYDWLLSCCVILSVCLLSWLLSGRHFVYDWFNIY